MMKSERSKRCRNIGASISDVSNGVSDAVDVSRMSISPTLRRPIIERHGAAAYGLRQLARAIQRAIADPKIGDATRDKRTCRALAGFTRAEHKHLALA